MSFVSFLLHLSCIIMFADGQRLKDRMYSDLKGAACFRRLNGTHEVGCTSDFRGSVGVLHLLHTEADLKFLLDDPPAPPYVAVLPPRLFTRKIVMQLKALAEAKGIINGILLINNRTDLTEFSHESQCPNEFSGLPGRSCSALKPETTWNPPGTDLLNEDFPFPIYYISSDSEIEKVIECFEKFNNFDLEKQHQRALCSVQVKTLMSAAGNSKICMDRTRNVQNLAPTNYCDALQGRNVYATLFERPHAEDRKNDPDEKFILVTARTDTVSMFDGHYLGAMDSLVPFITVLGAAQFLNVVLPKTDTKRNVLFMFFNGESLDYIGSQRFLYDLNNDLFPTAYQQRKLITKENIELMIDVGTLDDLNNVKIYHPEDFDLATKFIGHLNAYSGTFKLGINATDTKTHDLPPFSAQTFWRENITFPALIMTSTPKNRFFHSIFDDAANLNFTYMNRSTDFTQLEPFTEATETSIQYKIRYLATLLGMNLYDLVTGSNYTEKKAVNVGLIDEFLYCFLISSQCTLFKALIDKTDIQLPDRPIMRYIGVHTDVNIDEASAWAYKALGFVLGKKVDKKIEDCQTLPYSWYNSIDNRGDCLLTTHNFSSAMSPAFLDENYDWSSHKYSTWTESTWSELTARIFVQPSRTHNVLTLCTGIVVFVISLVFVYLVKSRADIIFADSVSTTPISPPANC